MGKHLFPFYFFFFFFFSCQFNIIFCIKCWGGGGGGGGGGFFFFMLLCNNSCSYLQVVGRWEGVSLLK